MGVRVLLIEDDETIAEPLADGLRHFGLTVHHVDNGTDGLRGPHGDVVLLDLGLPDMDGIDVCRGIRLTSDVPIIILSARGEEADRVLGLELGADDYLAKPFSIRELVARIRAVSRRHQRPGGGAGTGTGTEPYAQQPVSVEELVAQRESGVEVGIGVGVSGGAHAPARTGNGFGAGSDFGYEDAGRVGAGARGGGAGGGGADYDWSAAYDTSAREPSAQGTPFGGSPFGGTPAHGTPVVQGDPAFGNPPHGTPAYEPPVYEPPAYEQVPPEPRDSSDPAATDADSAPPPPGPLVVDRRTRQVWVGEVPVALTPKEFELLALLTEDPGAVYSRQQILNRVWDDHYQGPTKTLDVHVATLRRKLGDPAWIQPLRGVGFRLAVRTPGQGPGRHRVAEARAS